VPKLVISFFLAFSLIFTFASQQRILVFIFLPYFVLLLTVYTLVGRGVQKKQKPKTEPKNHLTEKNFQKINRTGKKFLFSVRLRFGRFENSVNRTEIRKF